MNGHSLSAIGARQRWRPQTIDGYQDETISREVLVADILVRDLDPDVLKQLKTSAKAISPGRNP